MPKTDLSDKLGTSDLIFFSCVLGACILAALFAFLLAWSRGSFLFFAVCGIVGVFYGRHRFLEARKTDPSKYLYVIHLNPKDPNNREWTYYEPGKHPFIPFNGISWFADEFDYDWHREEQEVSLFQEGKAIITFFWRPDLSNLQRFMESSRDQQVEYLRKSCAEFAVRRYESVAHTFDRAGRESLVQQNIPLKLDELHLGRGYEVDGFHITITKLPEPQPAPEPYEPWEGYEELHIGNTNGKAVFLDDEDLATHVQIIGASGFGKSKLVEYAVRQLVGKQGVILLDPNEQLYTDLVTWGAHKGHNGFLLLDPSDEKSDLGFNPFRLSGEKTPARIAARASRLLKTALRAGKFQGGDAVLAERIMRVLFYVLIEQDLPVTVLQFFMLPDVLETRGFDVRDFIMERCASSEIRNEWAMLTRGKKDNAYVAMMMSSATRLVGLFMEPGVSRILTNKAQLQIPSLVKNGEVLLVNLKDTPDIVSAEARNVIGTFLVDEVWSAIKGRSKQEAESLPGMNLVIDEFHNFATPEFAMMLKEGRKYGLHMWLINHAMDDLDREVQNALRACHTRIALGRTSQKDAASVLEGSKPGKDRSLRDEVEWVPGLDKRHFLLSRAGKQNVGCKTADVKSFPVPPEKLRAYVERITRYAVQRTDEVKPTAPEARRLSSRDDYDAPTVTYHRPTDPLDIVRELRYATVAHVARLTGDTSLKSQNTAKKLRALAEKGSLKKLSEGGRSVYCAPDAAEKHLEHELVITNLHVLLWDSIALWEQEGLKGDGINPDAFFATHRHFYLEAENSNPRSEAGESAQIKKARQYAEHADRRLHKTRCDNFHVLFVLSSEAKAKNLARAIAESGIPNPGRFWLSWGTTDAIDAHGAKRSLTTPVSPAA
jgi:hypothetical protein